MIHHLLDSSGLWRLLREEKLSAAWLETTTLRAIGSCAAQRAEFRRSARNAAEYEAMGEMFTDLYPEMSRSPRDCGTGSTRRSTLSPEKGPSARPGHLT